VNTTKDKLVQSCIVFACLCIGAAISLFAILYPEQMVEENGFTQLLDTLAGFLGSIFFGVAGTL
jgi:hypothetical protein